MTFLVVDIGAAVTAALVYSRKGMVIVINQSMQYFSGSINYELF